MSDRTYADVYTEAILNGADPREAELAAWVGELEPDS